MTLTIGRPTSLPDVVDDGTRREFIGAGIGLGAILLAGCGDDADDTATVATDGEFPVTISHALGRVTIDKRPERVVVLAGRDADTLLALGVVPVAIHSRYRFEKGVGPWAEKSLGNATPTVWHGPEINYEAISSARPDLIVNVTSGGEKDEYELLSQIAPTVALPEGAVPYGASTEDSTLLIASALGRPADGRRAIERLDAYLARQKAAHPRFAGRTANYVDVSTQGMFTYSRAHVINRTLYQVGFDPIPRSSPSGGPVKVSVEQLEAYDADVVLAYPFERSLDELRDEMPTLARQESVRNGRFFLLEDLALSNSSVLSIPYALDRLLPRIDRALST